jgi:hypothetical protein
VVLDAECDHAVWVVVVAFIPFWVEMMPGQKWLSAIVQRTAESDLLP